MENLPKKIRENEALSKTQMILPLVNPSLNNRDRIAMQKKIAEQNNVSYRTIGRYLASYQANGWKGLLPKEQAKSELRKISQKVIDEAIKIRRELDTRSIRDIITILEGENIVQKGTVKRATLQRYLQKAGFGKGQMLTYRKTENRSIKRFQKEHRNELWQGDIKYGPILPGNVQTYFIAWIDDCTRYIISCGFYMEQTEENVLKELRKALTIAGLPDAIYTDNGSQYISSLLGKVCTRLGIMKKRCPPRSGESKGKIERFNNTINSFISECSLQRPQTIDELNDNLAVWLEEGYQRKEHSALSHRTPEMTYLNDNKPLRLVTADILEEAFVNTTTRVVTASSFSLNGIHYEIPTRDITGEVTICYGITDTKDVLVVKEGFAPVVAKPIVITGDVDFDSRKNPTHRWDPVPVSSSRLLNLFALKFKERHPDSPIFKKKELENINTHIQRTGISYSSIMNNQEDN